MNHVAWKGKTVLTAACVTAFALAVVLLNGKFVNVFIPENLLLLKEETVITKNNNPLVSGCNLFLGRWIYDDVSYPLYKEKKCALMEEDFACETNGRSNLKYQNWRWQPHHCDLPRFNGTTLLEKLRNKKMVFVGDSLMRNQWRSFLCILEPYLPPYTTKMVRSDGHFLNFHVKDNYNATIAFYWSPYLVESDHDNINSHSSLHSRTIRFKSIENHGKNWINADIVLFDTFAWWITPKLTILWGSFNNPIAIYKQVNTSMRLYEIALDTWSEWLEFRADRNQTKFFFMSASPFAIASGNFWGTSASCYNATEPIFNDTYWANAVKRSFMETVESRIEKLAERGVKVEYLNITQLSGYRDDAHLSIYRTFWKSAKKDLNPSKYSDCMHWCLPGVPDTWNEILYAYIMKP